MSYLIYIIVLLVILLCIALYYIWQLHLSKHILTKDLQSKQIELEFSNSSLIEKDLELKHSNEKNILETRLDAINNKLGLIEHLNKNVANLQQIFGSKQHRGLFGERKLIDILQDELAASQYSIQKSLSTNVRPDVVIYLPTKPNVLAIDAKFPYESFELLKKALHNNEKLQYETYHKAFISDMKKHIKDIGNKYIIIGETQDFALLFIPAESIFTYIAEKCSDLQAIAAANKVVLCTPNILMLMIHIIKSLNKDQQMQLHARSIQENVNKLVNDINKLTECNKKLQRHFLQSTEDLETINKITTKIDNNIKKITDIEVENKPDITLPFGNTMYNIN